jgi:arabinofuranosyltransferase
MSVSQAVPSDKGRKPAPARIRVKAGASADGPEARASAPHFFTRLRFAVARSSTGQLSQVNVKRLGYLSHLPIVVIVLISIFYFFNFTAEDAFITYRYSENLVKTGALVYNDGEPINAMTSPLHALVSAAMYFVTGQTVLSNKLVALVLLLISALLVWQRFRAHPHWQVLTLVLVLMPPSVLLWTFGGLETPLLLFLVTVTVFLADRPQPVNLYSLCAVCVLAGLAFLTRYDSSLFMLPLVLHVALRARSAVRVLGALAVGALLPLAWLAVSVFYYGDIFPTSFYVKTPNGTLNSLFYNTQYVVAYLVFVGVVPVLFLAVLLLQRERRTLEVLRVHLKTYWWLYLGLLLQLVYGLTIATHHMMFSFRFFVPYIPATALVLVHLLQRAIETPVARQSTATGVRMFTGLLVGLVLFQTYQSAYTYNHSVNGLAPIGEYRSIGVRDYVSFIQILKLEALDIEQHWAQRERDEDRRPRILTYAAGMLPYTFKDSYIYEKLVSYRHCYQRHDQALYADYIHILVPRLGTVEQQLPRPEDSYTLISSYEIPFDGSSQSFLVYYNPAPEAHNLSVHISTPCRSEALPGSN